ncbi:hypothetical protein [Acaryochloris marina]|uniref:hypothetical protein n=1 Tax=Acaryochloris marina TaxID=155978 RepID=UPI0021C3AD82|nr:hypothetical protein [Acaryochloris marina]BDM83354.1 hypothetical protein AM10699_62150 [Acaryochloris marina MBIC10699]
MAIHQYARLVWGLAYASPHDLPWSQSPDFDPEEDWNQRLQRRVTLQNRQPEEFHGCVVDIHVHFDDPRYYVAIEESLVEAQDVAAESVPSFDIWPDWERRLLAFCNIMDIPWKEPRWFLVTYMV